MNSSYKKELTKIIILLVLGFVLAVFITVKAFLTYGGTRFEATDILILICIVLYPTGVFYGWRDMLRVFTNILSTDRVEHQTGGPISAGITIATFAFAGTAAVVFGWLFGVVNAYRKLQRAKHTSI
uniref:Uncharacterized protein n=1 Tax=Geobacillus sp. (strain WCH70) TaxID=471223 RepID=C5D8A8_GEOSW